MSQALVMQQCLAKAYFQYSQSIVLIIHDHPPIPNAQSYPFLAFRASNYLL